MNNQANSPESLFNQVVHGDCLEVLKSLPDNCIDSVVTDPPYDLTSQSSARRSAFPGHYHGDGFGRGQKKEKAGKGFMGKEWDGTGISFKVELWQEVLRVLKPGGHLLAFGGTRTYHRMACAIEDAGFEIRDCVQWLYGSGFPKSMDVSKNIDKRGGKSVSWFGEWLRKWRTKNGITQKEIAKLFPSKTGGLTGCVANWELGLNLPTPDQFNLICKTFNLPFENLKEAERDVLGKETKANSTYHTQNVGGEIKGTSTYDITAPATPEAEQWDGWGTALKPANEPVVLARKPLSEATIAANVLKWGTGAINIDGGRIGGRERTDYGLSKSIRTQQNCYSKPSEKADFDSSQGRFPANIILDEEAAAVLDAQSGMSKSNQRIGQRSGKEACRYGSFTGQEEVCMGHNDSGGASRFFYVAKASKKERGEFNIHPTVKPIALMQYLCRLITPPGGLILDPFGGSGTTALSTIREGFNYLIIEREAEYVDIINRRIKDELGIFAP